MVNEDRFPAISTRGWTIDTLLSQSANFFPAERVSLDSAELLAVIQQSEKNGTPLVIEGCHLHQRWPKDMFNVENFLQHSTSPDISVRNIHDWTDKKIPLVDFVAQCRTLSPFFEPGETTRYYGKDADCPPEWENWLHSADVVPDKFLPGGSDDVLHSDSDTVSVETLMCYLGIGDTFTPCHKDLCASSGQNLMCYTENDGSSFWFMTKSGDAGMVDRYFSNCLGQDLDHENHVITTRELARGGFPVFIVEQKLGDLVLVPPRSCHQVVNHGGITIKTSWSRMTLEGLETALYHELPLYQRVCRFETYRVKATVYRVLQEIVAQLGKDPSTSGQSGLQRQKEEDQAIAGPSKSTNDQEELLLGKLNHLLRIYNSILAEEFCQTHTSTTLGTQSPDAHLICDFCGCDIFQSYFECQDACFKTGGDGSQEYCVICPGCFIEGRACACGDMRPMQRYDFETLLTLRTHAIDLLDANGIPNTYEASFSKAIKSIGRPPSFKAACALHAFKATAYRKNCSIQAGGLSSSHECEPFWVLPCDRCHRARCFSHIAEKFKMHSIDALLLHITGGPRQEQYHIKHMSFLHSHQLVMEGLFEHQRWGTKPKGCALLLYNALYHRHCRPVRPEITNPGWYDEIMQGFSPEDNSEKTDFGIDEPIPISEEINLPLPLLQPEPKQTSSPLTTSKKICTVYVLVPALPYRIRPSSTRARDFLVQRPQTDSEPLTDSFIGSSDMSSESLSIKRTTSATSSCSVRSPKIPKIRRDEDVGSSSKNIQAITSTSNDTSNPPRKDRSQMEEPSSRQRYKMDKEKRRQEDRNRESLRGDIYKQMLDQVPRDGVFYEDHNGERKYGRPPSPLPSSSNWPPLPSTPRRQLRQLKNPHRTGDQEIQMEMVNWR